MFFSKTITNYSLPILILLLSVLTFANTNAQGLRAIDNKGTLKTIRNNRVFTANDGFGATAPNSTNTIIEGDIWLDDSGFYRVPKVWDDGKWKNLINNNELYDTPIARTSTNTVLSDGNQTLIIKGGNNIKITLPDPAKNKGKILRIKNNNTTESGGATVSGTSYYDDGDEKTKFPYKELIFIESDGSRWNVVKYTY